MLEILDSWGSQLHRDVGSENFSFFCRKYNHQNQLMPQDWHWGGAL
jgi:hypothetical protein